MSEVDYSLPIVPQLWQRHRDSIAAQGGTERQINEMEKAFYGGVMELLLFLWGLSEERSTDEGTQIMDRVMDECEEFVAKKRAELGNEH